MNGRFLPTPAALLILTGSLCAQVSPSFPTADSAGHDVIPASDSLQRMTIPPHPGTIDRFLDSSRFIDRSRFPWTAYRYAGDLLSSLPGAFLAEQGSEGQYSRLSLRGTDWRAIGIMADGRSLDDPAFEITNLYRFPVESADRFEILAGPRACIYGRASTGGVVNVVSRNYNSNRPLSTLTYAESGSNYSRTDGMFSQNISRTVNLTAGFQAQATDGRFPNGTHEQWNARSRVVITPRPDVTVIAAHHFVHARTGLSGGVDMPSSGLTRAFSPLLAVMVNTDAYEKTARHDVDLSILGTFLADSAEVSTLTLYYSRQVREYRDEENRPAPNGTFIQSDHTTSWMGGTARQAFVSSWQRLQAGASIELRQIEGSPNMGRRRNVAGSLWALEEFLLSENVRTGLFGRYDRYRGTSHGAAGADFLVAPAPWLTLAAGIASSRRPPTYQELFWTGDSVTRAGEIRSERHLVAEAGFALRYTDLAVVRISWFHRTVDDPVEITSPAGLTTRAPLHFANGSTIRINGVEAGIEARLWVFSMDAAATFLDRRDAEGTTLTEYPRLAGSGGVYYSNVLFGGGLTLKAGLRGRYLGSHAGMLFHPEALLFTPNRVYEPGQGSSIDFQLFGRIGDASIHFLWSNLTDARYFTAPFYPVRDREITFGITWQFLD